MAGRGRPSRETVYRRFAAAIEELTGSAGCRARARPSRSGTTSGTWKRTTRPRWKATRWCSVRSPRSSKRAELLAPRLSRTTWKSSATPRRPAGSTARGSILATGRPGELITLTEVRTVHRVLMTKVWEVESHPDATPQESPGNFRTHDLHPFGGGMQPPPHPEVPAIIADWVADVVTFGAKVKDGKVDPHDVPAGLATIHGQFERIHPFLDGNGRAGRLLLNLVLVRLGFPPAIIYKRQRHTYLDALDRADKGDPGLLAELSPAR